LKSDILTRGDFANLSRFVPQVFGFPDKLMTKLRYHESGTLSTGLLGALNNYNYVWNSTFDPNSSGVGHQPMYRDNFAAVYDHYSVTTARATIRIWNASSTDPMMVGVHTDDDTTVPTDYNQFAEANHSNFRLIGTKDGNQAEVVFRPTWSCKKFLSIDPFTSETYKTPVGSNPTEQSILSIACANVLGNVTAVQWEIMLEQDVLWSELTTQPLS
jgi:hypothetical protein